MRKGLLFLIALFCAQTSIATENCKPHFPYKDQWLGGDAIYSVRLNDEKVLWMFGDTFVGEEYQGTRNKTSMVGNSVAVSTCKNGKFHINYFPRIENNQARDYFQANFFKVRYWPFDGFMHQGQLYVFLVSVKELHHDSPFGFELLDVRMAVVSNPFAPPSLWKIDYKLILANKDVFPGVSAVKDDQHVTLFAVVENAPGVKQRKRHPQVLVRFPLSKLHDPGKNLQYYSKNESWEKGFDLADAKEVIPAGHTEMTVRYNKKRGLWTVVHPEPIGFTNTFVMRTAPKLTGPWSDYFPIYRAPEMDKSSPMYQEKAFCYAPKEQTTYSTGSEDSFWLTYICNSFVVQNVFDSTKIYKPRVEEVPYPF